MRITSKGQVTIPQHIREAAGLLPNTEVEFEMVGDEVRLRRVDPAGGGGRGRRAVESLRGRGSLGMSTDELMALLRSEESEADDPDEPAPAGSR